MPERWLAKWSKTLCMPLGRARFCGGETMCDNVADTRQATVVVWDVECLRHSCGWKGSGLPERPTCCPACGGMPLLLTLRDSRDVHDDEEEAAR